MRRKDKDCIPIISLFTGGGFMDMGFEKAGFKTIFANEFNPRIAEAFAVSFNKWSKRKKEDWVLPINDSISDLSKEKILNVTDSTITNKVFGVIGGPPCQDFSSSGEVLGLRGERGKYTLDYIEKVLALEPHFFVMENVKGLARFNSLKEDFKYILNQFSSKFYTSFDIHNALSFNVPQHRERLILIGIRKDLINFMIGENLSQYLLFPPKKMFNKKSKLNKSQQTGKYLLNGQSNLKNHSFPNLKPSSLRKVLKIAEGETNRRSFRRISRFSYSPTLSFGNNEVFLHPLENRRLSVRECLRLQGVDDSYCFDDDVSLTTMYKIISNGVPVPLAKGIAKSLMNFLVKSEIISNSGNNL